MLIAGVVAVAGCGGGGDDAQEVENAAKAFSRALVEGNGRKGCDLMTEKARKALITLAAQKGKSCEETFNPLAQIVKGENSATVREAAKNPKVRDVKVSGDSATAQVTVQGSPADKFGLRKVDGDWKVAVTPLTGR